MRYLCLPTVMLITLFCAFSFPQELEVIERHKTYIQEVCTKYFEKENLKEGNIIEICITPLGILALSQNRKIFQYKDGNWSEINLHPPFQPNIIASTSSALIITNQNHLATLKYTSNQDTQFTWVIREINIPENISSIYPSQNSDNLIYLLSEHTITEFLIEEGKSKTTSNPNVKIYALTEGKNNEIFIGTDNGIYKHERNKGEWTLILPDDGNKRWAPKNVKALTFDKQGNLWFGSKEGVGRFNGNKWILYTGKEGLPWNEFNKAISGEKDDVVWFATTKGAIRHENGKFTYRFSHRWLPHDFVNTIAVDNFGNAWIGTPEGISLIERKSMTLEEKSDYFISQVEQRHNRDGYIAVCKLKERYNPNSFEPAITDNDGLYTSMYGSAHAFRYAVTKDPKSKEIATRSLLACKKLVDITGLGFPARVVIPIDWPEPVNEIEGAEYNAKRLQTDPLWKQITPRFVKSNDGKYLWKCDTSSDELAGHYFFYGIYYDLVAETEEEKLPAREVVKTITDHLINNNYCLIDHDGKPTRWAFFSPEMLHSLKGWEQRGLNSMMILSFLKVAHHITGEPIYQEKFQELCDKYFYHINAMQSKMYYPPDFVVPWDNNLCLMSWYGLFKYENDAEKLILWRIALEHAWLHAHRMKNPFWNLLYLACTKEFEKHLSENKFEALYTDAPLLVPMILKEYAKPNPIALYHAVETLKKVPLDLISYCIDNTHRLDVQFDIEPPRGKVRGWAMDGFALPIDERPHVRHDDDPFTLNSCNGTHDGFSEHEGTFYLLPYWLGVYHGFIK